MATIVNMKYACGETYEYKVPDTKVLFDKHYDKHHETCKKCFTLRSQGKGFKSIVSDHPFAFRGEPVSGV